MSDVMAQLRGVSRQVYGNSYLLEVAAAISAGPPKFTQKAVADSADLDKNLVSTVLTRLEKAELVSRTESSGRERPYRRATSVFWQLASAHHEELLAPSVGDR